MRLDPRAFLAINDAYHFFEQAGGVAVKSVTGEFGVERRTFQFQVESDLGSLRALLIRYLPGEPVNVSEMRYRNCLEPFCSSPSR